MIDCCRDYNFVNLNYANPNESIAQSTRILSTQRANFFTIGGRDSKCYFKDGIFSIEFFAFYEGVFLINIDLYTFPCSTIVRTNKERSDFMDQFENNDSVDFMFTFGLSHANMNDSINFLNHIKNVCIDCNLIDIDRHTIVISEEFVKEFLRSLYIFRRNRLYNYTDEGPEFIQLLPSPVKLMITKNPGEYITREEETSGGWKLWR